MVDALAGALGVLEEMAICKTTFDSSFFPAGREIGFWVAVLIGSEVVERQCCGL